MSWCVLCVIVSQGVARSMPTGAALDRVAKAMNLPFFETPTGAWVGVGAGDGGVALWP